MQVGKNCPKVEWLNAVSLHKLQSVKLTVGENAFQSSLIHYRILTTSFHWSPVSKSKTGKIHNCANTFETTVNLSRAGVGVLMPRLRMMSGEYEHVVFEGGLNSYIVLGSSLKQRHQP